MKNRSQNIMFDVFSSMKLMAMGKGSKRNAE